MDFLIFVWRMLGWFDMRHIIKAGQLQRTYTIIKHGPSLWTFKFTFTTSGVHIKMLWYIFLSLFFFFCFFKGDGIWHKSITIKPMTILDDLFLILHCIYLEKKWKYNSNKFQKARYKFSIPVSLCIYRLGTHMECGKKSFNAIIQHNLMD